MFFRHIYTTQIFYYFIVKTEKKILNGTTVMPEMPCCISAWPRGLIKSVFSPFPPHCSSILRRRRSKPHIYILSVSLSWCGMRHTHTHTTTVAEHKIEVQKRISKDKPPAVEKERGSGGAIEMILCWCLTMRRLVRRVICGWCMMVCSIRRCFYRKGAQQTMPESGLALMARWDAVWWFPRLSVSDALQLTERVCVGARPGVGSKRDVRCARM